MRLIGHKTESIDRRYAIVSDAEAGLADVLLDDASNVAKKCAERGTDRERRVARRGPAVTRRATTRDGRAALRPAPEDQ